MGKSPPIVWILLPDIPQDHRSLQEIVHEQWNSSHTWMTVWLWWCFVWWNRAAFQTASMLRLNEPLESLTELKRLLGGDVQVSMLRLGQRSNEDLLRGLAPKSHVFLFSLNLLPSQHELDVRHKLKQSLAKNQHSITEIAGFNQNEQWMEAWIAVLATQLRHNILKQSTSWSDLTSQKKTHLILWIRRDYYQWNSLSSSLEKQRYLLSERLNKAIDGCQIHILHHKPASAKILDTFNSTDEVWYAFLDDITSEATAALLPCLQRDNLHPLQPHLNIQWLRLLREVIWNATELGP